MGKRIDVVPYRASETVKVRHDVLDAALEVTVPEGHNFTEPVLILAHKRALKAAQMRRYRAKKAGK